MTYYLVGDDRRAIDAASHSLSHHPIWLTSEAVLLAAAQRANLATTVRTALRRMQANHAGLTVADVRHCFPFRYQADFERLAGYLRAAGLPVG